MSATATRGPAAPLRDAKAAPTAVHPAPGLARAPRLACAAGAAATSTLGLALLLGSWQPRTELLWLTASPAAHAEILACDLQPGAAARASCRQAIVDERLHGARRSVTVANAPAPASLR